MKSKTMWLWLCLTLAVCTAGILAAAPGPPGGHCEGCPAACWECWCPPPQPCPLQPPPPECSEHDGSNQRFCGIHDYALLMAEHQQTGDGIDGMVVQFADPITNVFLCTDGYVDFWTSREDMLIGLPPVLTMPFIPPTEPWCSGVAFVPAKRAMRIRGHVGKIEDVVYAD